MVPPLALGSLSLLDNMPLLDDYRRHAFYYSRKVDDLNIPWDASPVTSARPLPPSAVGSPVLLSSSSISRSVRRTKKTLKFRLREVEDSRAESRKQSHISFFRSVRRLLRRTKVLKMNVQLYDPIELTPAASPPIPLSEWKAWGYYARPCINEVEVDNLSPAPPLTVEVDEQMMFDYLRSPGGTEHPERWIKGRKHRALPPRPSLWKPVDPHEPFPFPWECQLNPLLTQSLVSMPGLTPLYWNLSLPANCLCFVTDGPVHFVLDEDLSQPATHPFLTHMYLNAYAFEPEWNVQHKLQWPLMLESRDGIICADVIEGVYRNFQEYVKNSEFEQWPSDMQRTAEEAHRKRPKNVEKDAFMRRVDVLGENLYFRGLAPSMNMEGWVLLLGSEPPSMRKEGRDTSGSR